MSTGLEVGTRRSATGAVAGVGSSSGARILVAAWDESPDGPYCDVFVERADGHRVLLAPSREIADVVSEVCTFDEVRVEPVEVEQGATHWAVRSPSLRLDIELGERHPAGRALRLLPRSVVRSERFATLVAPLARRMMRGVLTRDPGHPRSTSYFGASDLRRIRWIGGTFDGEAVGSLAPVFPPTRFGYFATPREPMVTWLRATTRS